MTTLPNDDFDMCCGNRPHVTHDATFRGREYLAQCGVCGDWRVGDNAPGLMRLWNKLQKEKVKYD